MKLSIEVQSILNFKVENEISQKISISSNLPTEGCYETDPVGSGAMVAARIFSLLEVAHNVVEFNLCGFKGWSLISSWGEKE